MYKGQKQFTANVFYNSSWALFTPDQLKGSEKTVDKTPKISFEE